MRSIRPASGAAQDAAGAQVSLGEGNTPLVRSRWIGPQLGLEHLSFKLEQTNPTGSYKDRFAARLVSLLVAGGHDLCLGTSSGNAGAAMAAYSAAAGIRCVLCVPADAPAAKLTQIQAYGARLLRIPGMVDSPGALRAVLDRLRAVVAARGMPLGTSAYALSPEAMKGNEPIGQELVAQLGAPPDRVFAPMGSGGLVIASRRGLLTAGAGATRVHAVQPASNDTLVSALHAGESRAREVTTPGHTNISGLGIPIDLDASAALAAVRDSGGDGHLVDDDLVWEMQAHLVRHEGLYVEPAGAASVAGMWQAAQATGSNSRAIGSHERVVCLLTGHGFKDERAAQRLAGAGSDRGLVVEPDEIDERLLDRLRA